MTALDTNVLVRLVLEDDPDQTARAEALVLSKSCFIPTTVLLELAWVLRTSGKMAQREVVARLRLLIDLPTVSVEHEAALLAALDDADAGMDLADAFHRACSPGSDRLATFDRHFASVAATRPGLPVEAL